MEIKGNSAKQPAPRSLGQQAKAEQKQPNQVSESKVGALGANEKPSTDTASAELQSRMMHLRGTVGAGKMTGRADKIRTEQSQKPAVDPTIANDLKAEMRAGILRGVTADMKSLSPDEQALNFSPQEAKSTIKKHTSWGNLDEAGLGRELADKAKNSPSEGAKAIQETLDELSDSDRDDVSLKVVENMSDKEVAEMAKTEEGTKTLDRMRKDLDDGWTSGEEKAAMNKIDQAKTKATEMQEAEAAQEKKDKSLRPDSLEPSKEQSSTGGNDPLRSYKTGDNTTKVRDSQFETKSPEEAKKAIAATKAEQEKSCNKMTKALGKTVSNPPSMADTKAYFQKVAGKGTKQDVAKVKQEYQEHLSAFYVHPGRNGGVNWKAGKELANQLPQPFENQPRLKDGRQIIDCMGFAAFTEHVVGGIKDPKDPSGNTPMFEIQHVGTHDHIATGVFRKGDNEAGGFSVNNNQIEALPQEDYNHANELLKKFGGKKNSPSYRMQVMKKAASRLMDLKNENTGEEIAPSSKPSFDKMPTIS